jgi:hypothetical protein
MSVVAAAAARYATDGYFTVVDGIVIPGWFFEPLRGSLEAAGQEVAFAVLRMPLAECVERVRAREGGPPLDESAIAGIGQSFAALGELERHVLELAGESPEQVADALDERLADGSLRA